MAHRQIIKKFPIMYEILKYAMYADEAIGLLNSLCITTQETCYRNIKAFLIDQMHKRVITIDHNDKCQTLTDPRIAYFAIHFKMNGNF
jgi:hypothetical protein